MTVSTAASWERELGTLDRLAARLVYISRHPRGKWATYLLRLLAVDIPPSVMIGSDLYLLHVGGGHVLHSNVTIGCSVVLNPGVVVGRAELWRPPTGDMEVLIGDHVILGANSSVMVKENARLSIGEGTVLGANSVLTGSTGDWEIWAGLPARKLRDRPR
jgi:serine O-acetyltransferase